jgi:UDP-N-acetylglucosamine 2-epimerase (non-hydrolysing)
MDNLRNEGINSEKVHFVGNVMIDTLLANREKASRSDVLERLGLSAGKYAVITLHRPSNVDDLGKLSEIMTAFEKIQREMKLVFPIHPRTRNNIKGTPLGGRIGKMENLILLEPVGYLDFLCLMSNAALVMTDSGGIQEETTILGVPCMTLRKSTERPVTITEGTNRLCALSAGDIVRVYKKIMDRKHVGGRVPKFWDGRAAERIAKLIIKDFNS